MLDGRVVIGDPAECWIAKGSTSDGYPRIQVNGKRWLMHRLVWTIFRGEIPFGMLVLHTCDVRRCCNPCHLFLGTNADNMADMKAKGRGRGRHSAPVTARSA